MKLLHKGIGTKKYQFPARHALNWYLIHPKCAVADAALHRRPNFAGVLRARATSQPLATLRAMLTLPILFNCVRVFPRGHRHHTPSRDRLQYLSQRFAKKFPPKRWEFFEYFLIVLTISAFPKMRYAYLARDAPMAFMRLMTISPIFAISSAVKA